MAEDDETVTVTPMRVNAGLAQTPNDVVISTIAGSATFTITNDDAPAGSVTFTETADATTPTEGGTDEYGMVLDTQPTANVTITPTSGAPGTATVNPNNPGLASAVGTGRSGYRAGRQGAAPPGR